MSHY